jgi:hypothetical protein
MVEILVAEGAKVAWCGRDEERLNASKHYILEKFPHANSPALLISMSTLPKLSLTSLANC